MTKHDERHIYTLVRCGIAVLGILKPRNGKSLHKIIPPKSVKHALIHFGVGDRVFDKTTDKGGGAA